MTKIRNVAIFFATVVVIWACKPQEEVLPELSVTATNQVDEGDAGSSTTVNVTIKMDVAANTYPVTVNYYTRHISTDDSDFEFISSDNRKTVTFNEGELVKEVQIAVYGDDEAEAHEEFSVNITGAENAVLSPTREAVVSIRNDDKCSDCGYITPTSYSGYELVWGDEFNGTDISTDNWRWELGGNGWGNQESQYYTDRRDNSYIENGDLVIVAKKENFSGSAYTSARMITSGKQSFQYGRVDIRAKLPDARGTWPALWMLGDNIWDVSWPKCGEIDIMELVGYDPLNVHATGHWGNSVNDKGISGSGFYQEDGFADHYHVYSLIWNTTGMTFYVDDVKIHEIKKTDVTGYEYPFDQKFFFIFNIAVGGTWGGIQGIDDSAFPQEMRVDYVRVFQ